MNHQRPLKGRLVYGLLALLLTASCKPSHTPAPVPDPAEDEPEAIARTEFTERIENFFEYQPLKAGQPSVFRIHLTDLADGSPVEKAAVTLTARHAGVEATEVAAKVGKVTGIYVAELAIPSSGAWDIEFHIRNEKIDERLPLSGFMVE